MKNSLRFSSLVLNTKVGRDIQVSSLHTELKKKNHVEVNKPSCITPGGRGLQFVFIYTYAQNSVFQQKKNLPKSNKSHLLLWHFKTSTALPKDTNTINITPYVLFSFSFFFFSLSLNCPVQEKVLTKFHRPKMCKLVSLYTAMTSGISEISP